MAQADVRCAETAIQADIWDTNEVRSAEAFDYYREGICTAFMPLRPKLGPDDDLNFNAKVESFSLGDGVLNFVTASAHDVIKGDAEVASWSEECYHLNFVVEGECNIRQGNKIKRVRSGEAYLFDSTLAFELNHGTNTSMKIASLMVPKHQLQTRLDGAPKVISRHRVFGPLMAEAMFSLKQAVTAAPRAEVMRLHKLVLAIASTAANDLDVSENNSARSMAQLHRVKQYVRKNCMASDFKIAECALEVGLSVRYIQQLFAHNNERFGSFILKERLSLASQKLSHPQNNHLPVSSIAFSVGFTDLSHFGRAFRAEYGQSPGAWRNSIS